MFAIYTCLTERHDYGLVALAAAVCLFASLIAVKLLKRIVPARGPERMVLLSVAASVTGIGIWSTHFIAMLAFHTQLAANYDLPMTLLSLVVCIAMVGSGFYMGLKRRLPVLAASGGLVVGAGIGAMHYLGMAAYEIPGVILWDKGLVAWSIGIGAALASLAGYLAYKAQGVRGQVVAALVFTVSICGLHFTGMGAATVLPDASVSVEPAAVPGAWLAAAIAAGALTLLALSAFGLLLDKRLARAEHRRRQELADTAVEGLLVSDGERVVSVNASFLAIAGRSEEDLVGQPLAALFPEEVSARLASGSREHFETEMVRPDGDRVPVEVFTRRIDLGGAQLGVAVRDLRARKLADAQIRFLAHHDPLTGLANRTAFHEQFLRELERRRRRDDALAVLCLDLDRFKPINDMFGHAVGDQVLREFSRRVRAELHDDDVLARLGGDEFAIIRAGDCRPAALGDLCSRILAAVASEFEVEGRLAPVGVSIGIALYPNDGEDAETLMRNADAALYRAKADGRGAFRFFEPEIGVALANRQGLEFDLRVALARGEMSLVYQPQTEVRSGETFGFEALLRWKHPERGKVGPDVFIPIAEDTGLITQIGDWVLRQACAEAVTWPKPLQIAVNLSPVQLHSPGLPDRVAEVLAETGLEPGRLELEITETALVQDFDLAIQSLTAIKALGVKVAMDDFGTGYSSLSTLRAFPFDKIKIDQSFIRNVQTNDQAAAIVRAIVGLARGLKLKVLAEGVETVEELAFLAGESCAEAQGFYFGRPGEISEFADIIAGEAKAKAVG